jgi:hypothetical protein
MKRDIPIHHITFTPLDKLLDMWIRFQRRGDNRGNGGFKGRDSILQSDSLRDSEQLCDAVDEEVAQGVDACISSLTAQHSWAIKKRCNIASVWRFPSLDYESTLMIAEFELERKLKRNIATANYF